MKKISKFFSIIFTVILPSSMLISCTNKTPPEIKFIAIPDKIVEEIYNNTISDFELFLEENYGFEGEANYDFYFFNSLMNDSLWFSTFTNKFKSIFEKNKEESLKNISYKNDDVKLYNIEEKFRPSCITIKDKQCDIYNTIEEDEKIDKIADYKVGNVFYRISSTESKSYAYEKELIFPVKNYYINKKDFTVLWNDHNKINDEKIEHRFTTKNSFEIKEFKDLNIEEGIKSLEQQLLIINKVEDFFGDWIWWMKERKSASFMYTTFTEKFRKILPIDNRRYDQQKFSKTKPENDYCAIIDKDYPNDNIHYCGQLENIKDQLETLSLQENENPVIEISFKVYINEAWNGILENLEYNYFELYFGKITALDSDLFSYSYY